MKKLAIIALFLGLGLIVVWLLVMSVSTNGLWTLFYIPQAGLLVLFAYIYGPVLLSILARPLLKKLIWPNLASAPVGPQTPTQNFLIIIPAHNEASVLPTLLKSIQALQYPANLVKAWVVADNCADNTVELARTYGFNCLERHTDRPSNKGQALTYGWQNLKNDPFVVDKSPIILLIDADCELAPAYLQALNRAFSRPNSPQVLQSFRAISNYQSSSVSTLDAAAEALRQWVELGSRYLLGLEGRICGTGVGFQPAVFAYLMELQQHNLAEDKAWQASLFKPNYRVGWCPAAHLSTPSTENSDDFKKQRRRWVSGQLSLIKMYAAPMLKQGLLRANLSQLDYALSILQLPRSFMLGLGGLFGLMALIVPQSGLVACWAWWLLTGLFFGYAAYGLFLIKAPARLYLRLLKAPLLVGQVFWLTFRGLLGGKVKNWEAMRVSSTENTVELTNVNQSIVVDSVVVDSN